MFTDVGIPRSADDGTTYVDDYSFCEPVFWPNPDGTVSEFQPDPTIHFRHNGAVNVVWCDGHVSSRKISFTTPGRNVYGGDNEAALVGWFGPKDNSLFDTE